VEPAALADVVSEIRDAIAQHGLADRADWLRSREEVLRMGDQAEVDRARRELSQVVHGMGGLLDIHWGSSNDRVHLLIDQLWEATRGSRSR
jgi:hypothetical protein